jgi:hypothetical protein
MLGVPEPVHLADISSFESVVGNAEVLVECHRKILAAITSILLGAIIACGGSTQPATTPTHTTSAGPAAATSVFVGEELSSGSAYEILQFSATANGAVAPVSTLKMPAGLQINGIANDATGAIYVAGQPVQNKTSEILVYAAGATGSASPIRTIVGSATGLGYSICLTVDAIGLLYVCGADNTISVFSPTANGNIAPIRVISGSATLLSNPYRIAVDAIGNIYVGNGEAGIGRILIFPAGATGNVTPSILTGAATSLGNAFGLAVDSAGNLYVISHPVGTTTGVFGILEFAPGAIGNVAPTKTIAGNATGIFEQTGIAVDALGSIFVVGSDNVTFVPKVAVFPPTASGNIAPATIIQSTAWDDASMINLAIY